MSGSTRLFLLIAAVAIAQGCGSSDPVLRDRDGGREDGGMDPVDGGPTDPDGGPMTDRDGGPIDPDGGSDGGPIIVCGEDVAPMPADPTAGSWSDDFGLPGANGDLPTVSAIDFGPAGEPYVAGRFTYLGGSPAAGVAVYTAAGWQALGAGFTGWVSALSVAPSGDVVVAVDPEDGSGNVEIHQWNGTAWSSLGVVVNADGPTLVHALDHGSDGTLYAGGLFTSIGGVAAQHLARKPASGGWSALAGAVPNGDVQAILAGAGEVCVGGGFDSIGVIAAQNVACHDGTSWSARSLPQPYYMVESLARDSSGNLLAGGTFFLHPYPPPSGVDEGGGIARWNGTAWELIGGGVLVFPDVGAVGSVDGIAVVGDDIYIGGSFSYVGAASAATPMKSVAKWDGSAWVDLGGVYKDVGFSLDTENVQAVAADPAGHVWFGGLFTVAGTRTAAHLAKYDGTYWTVPETPGQRSVGVNGFVDSLAAHGDCGLYVGGAFSYVGHITANNVARYDGAGSWTALDDGLAGVVRSLAVTPEGVLYAGGEFTDGMMGGRFYNIAQWDGTSWSGLGAGVDGPVYALAYRDGELWVGGSFATAGGVAAPNLAMWDGTTWSAPPGGVGGYVTTILFDTDGSVVIGGEFTTAGPEAATYVARWDGTRWSAIGDGFDAAVRSLAIYGGRLVAGGNFTASGTTEIHGVASWDGTSWSQIGEGLYRESWGLVYVNDFAVVGDVLFAAGDFSLATGSPDVRMAYYDGTSWVALGAGLNDIAEELIARPEGVYVGGTQRATDGVPAVGLGLWQFGM